jgi:proline iminopeptidase
MRKLVLLLLCATFAFGEVKTGGSKMIAVDGGKYNVWTKRIGSGPVKLLTLHGGPGFPHDYLEPFEDFLPKGVELYYYDQLGVGNSDQPTDASLWTVSRYTEEVEEVRRGLGIDKMVLYGSSWGGMLAIEYALAHPEHIEALIISDMTASAASYVKYANELRAQLPEEDQKILAKYEATGDYENPEYQQVMFGKIYAEHLVRINPWPEPVARSFKKFNPQIYNTMQGPNEFVVTGNFKDWDRWNDLAKIKVPTLLIAGKHGTMRPDDIRRMGKLIPNSRVVITEGSHLEMYDAQDEYFQAINRFLDDLRKGKASLQK